MAAERFTITFADGSAEDVVRRPVHWMMSERKLSKDAGGYETVLSTLWFASGQPGRSFEEWAETVDDWDKAEADARPPASSPATSPD